MNIVLLSNTMGRGGAEMQIKDYALRLVALGHRVLVVSMLPFEDFEAELNAGMVETATLGMSKGKLSAAGLPRLVGALVRFRPDVVHAHMFAAIFASRLARAVLEPLRLAGLKRPVMIGTSHAPFERAPRRYLAYRLTEPFSDLWTNVCREGIVAHERSRAVKPGRGILTTNGIDVQRFRPDAKVRAAKREELGVDADTFLWLSVGSFRDDQKDYPNLLRAAAELGDGRKWRLAIAGGGVLLDEMVTLARELGIAGRVEFLGLRSDVLELMQASDGFVLGSWFEAMPIVLLEAIACGLPCVATDVGQNADIVAAGAGMIVPFRNSSALSAAMQSVQSAAEVELRAMGERARAHAVAAFSLDGVVRGWEARYLELARAAAHARAEKGMA